LAINCKLNNKYKEALATSKKFIKRKKLSVHSTWNLGHSYTEINFWYKDKFNLGRNTYGRFRRLSCCGIDEGIFSDLMNLYNIKSWHKDWNGVVAWWLKNKGRTRKDSRVFVTGLPVKVKRGSGYNANFYKKLRKTLLSWGCKELTRNPYKNLNSKNYLSVIVGQF
jgi:hypothetical protein